MFVDHLRPTSLTTIQIVVGLWLFGVGLAFVVRGANGQGAWTVFHDGLSQHTPLSIGGATVLTGLVILVVVLAMRVRIGLGTLLNIAIIGPATDTTLWLLDEPDSTFVRVVLTLASPFVIALGSSLYLGVHWGPGPRDGLMTGLNERGVSIRLARFLIELIAFVIGFVLGGAVGWGSVWAVLAIGPAVQWMLPWFDRPTVVGSPDVTWQRDAMQTQVLIGGTWSNGTEQIAVHNPATGELIATVAGGGPAEAAAAVEAADRAQRSWSATAPRVRAEILRSCWSTLIDHTDELATLITLEHGKPLADAKGEIAYAAEFFRWNSEEAVRIDGMIKTAPGGSGKIIVHHPPVGVVVMVTPWNFPAAMMTRKVAPALAAGNACVIKPPAETPLTALRVAQLLEDAGVPAGLVNVVPTSTPGEWFDAATEHRATRMVSFTGSTAVGRILLKRCADRVLKVGMELGGNAPLVVFEDADLDLAVEGAMIAKMRHSAEVCTAANRMFVHADVADGFTERLAQAMGAVKVGNGMDDGVTCGPMINEEAIVSIDSLVKSALADGASVATGGTPIDGPGFFYAPTVLGDVTMGSPITQEEIFGPVAPVISFTDTDQMIDWANDTEMGLAAYVFSRDIGRALGVGERIQAGMVGINRGAMSDPAAPFGGMKQSGLGREGAHEGIFEFCETQYLAADW